jgi:hypothetical protein
MVIYAIKPASMRSHTMIRWSFCLLFALGQAGCQHHVSNAEHRYLEEVHFRSEWDYAIGRLSYDEVIKSWGCPTSVVSGYPLQETGLDGVPIFANWHWSDPVALTPQSPLEDVNLRFGRRIELVFNRKTWLLMDWKYWEWGAISLSYRHEESKKVLLPTAGILITQ